MGCSPWGRTESDTTERLTLSLPPTPASTYVERASRWRSWILWAARMQEPSTWDGAWRCGRNLRPQAVTPFWKWKWSCSVISDSAIPRTVAGQVPLSMGILQARVLEWVAISLSRGFSPPRDRTRVPCIARRLFILWATRIIYFKFIYLFLTVLGLPCSLGFSVVSLCGLLLAVASVVAKPTI